MKILIICSHPDDEVIGCGGAISKHSEKGDEVYICVVSEGVSGQFAGKDAIKTRRSHANLAGKVLGIKEYFFHDFPNRCIRQVFFFPFHYIATILIRDFIG